jgi:hypothetical protein
MKNYSEQVKYYKARLTELNERYQRTEMYKGGEFDYLGSVDSRLKKIKTAYNRVKMLLKFIRKAYVKPVVSYTAKGLDVLKLYPFSILKNKRLNKFKEYWRWATVEGFGQICIPQVNDTSLLVVTDERGVINYVEQYEEKYKRTPVFTININEETWYNRIEVC